MRSKLLLPLLSISFSGAFASDIRDDYNLTPAVMKLAEDGFKLYLAGSFFGEYNGGHYTDPRPEERVQEFWSEGVWCKIDRDNNGHNETIFLIKKDRLNYAGSIGSTGTFVHTAKKYDKFKKTGLGYFLREVKR